MKPSVYRKLKQIGDIPFSRYAAFDTETTIGRREIRLVGISSALSQVMHVTFLLDKEGEPAGGLFGSNKVY